MRYDLLLCDADGTLFDFHQGEINALKTVFTRFSLHGDDAHLALYHEINKQHWERFERGETTQARLKVERFADFLKASNQQGDASELCTAFVSELGKQQILLPDALELCKEVSKHMPIYLVTNGLSAVQRGRFTSCALTPYLSGMIISEEVGHPKPDPTMLEMAMQSAGIIDKGRVLMMGDSISADIAAANNAGIDSLLFWDQTLGKPLPQDHKATKVCATLVEAREIILT